ncbi:nucleotide-binding universal stress UspA family protein [Kribbella orskensis]|uniref:Nucleotide-binding universal stress UspA family protein n=1 Tax=Kribbella orskensis TaxID=2512216 RepID=A0ABY2B846_9ACTN|nr:MULTISPECIES: universal stress protein [Kribbella]TCN30680.1 nucleotide-binding universal stress UspA family protein [Kribbella sp. VKM Ac-2500]TCO11399.1 nucleotide-binding universal stress UspA family protein [Kribbella orskensis]
MDAQHLIYVGIDGSWRDACVLEWACEESAVRRVPVRAIHVVDQLHDSSDAPEVLKSSGERLVEDVQQLLNNSSAAATSVAELAVGLPSSTLAKLAADSEMLVVGRRGLGGFKRLLIGSTSEAVANLAQEPVVIVPADWQAPRQQAPVLVGVDASDKNEDAIGFAVVLAAERHVPLRMVHVWHLPPIYNVAHLNIAATERHLRTAQRHLETIAERTRRQGPGLEIHLELRQGHPVENLLEAADASQARLIVVGAVHARRLSTMLLGSVTRGVLHHATTPLAIVHDAIDKSR